MNQAEFVRLSGIVSRAAFTAFMTLGVETSQGSRRAYRNRNRTEIKHALVLQNLTDYTYASTHPALPQSAPTSLPTKPQVHKGLLSL